MQARWTAAEGGTQEVPFSFESESDRQGAMFTMLGKAGELFRGRYVRVEQSTKGHLVTAVYEGFSGPEWEIWGHDSEGHGLPPASPSASSHASTCQISDGGPIDLEF